jgi:hypothetical protein
MKRLKRVLLLVCLIVSLVELDWERYRIYLLCSIASLLFVLGTELTGGGGSRTGRCAPSNLVEKRADVLRGPLAQGNGISAQNPLDTVGRGG